MSRIWLHSALTRSSVIKLCCTWEVAWRIPVALPTLFRCLWLTARAIRLLIVLVVSVIVAAWVAATVVVVVFIVRTPTVRLFLRTKTWLYFALVVFVTTSSSRSILVAIFTLVAMRFLESQIRLITSVLSLVILVFFRSVSHLWIISKICLTHCLLFLRLFIRARSLVAWLLELLNALRWLTLLLLSMVFGHFLIKRCNSSWLFLSLLIRVIVLVDNEIHLLRVVCWSMQLLLNTLRFDWFFFLLWSRRQRDIIG